MPQTHASRTNRRPRNHRQSLFAATKTVETPFEAIPAQGRPSIEEGRLVAAAPTGASASPEKGFTAEKVGRPEEKSAQTKESPEETIEDSTTEKAFSFPAAEKNSAEKVVSVTQIEIASAEEKALFIDLFVFGIIKIRVL